MNNLLLTVRWLDDRYHGLLDREGPPEWPPSPYRFFQALVAGVARCGQLESNLGEALAWLQSLDPPINIAPRSRIGQIVTRFVPNNDGDREPDRQKRLTGKTSQPTLMLDPPEIHYLWSVTGCDHKTEENIRAAARCLTTLGWGIDMAFADAHLVPCEEIAKLKGIRWYPRPGAFRDDGLLRVPFVSPATNHNTLCDLKRAHESARKRIEHGKPLRSVDKPRVFDRVVYESIERPLGRPCVVFALHNDNGDFFTHSHANLIHVAGMLRHAAIEATDPDSDKGYPPPEIRDPKKWVEKFVAGHRDQSCDEHEQFSYVPLPSIGHEHADALIRRVMIVAPFSQDASLRHLSEQLDGVRLTPEGSTATALRPILDRIRPDNVARCYLATADTWQTVTPVILPGHDDHRSEKTKKLIQRALQQSGIDTPCEFNWQSIPFFKNTLSAHKYDRQGRHVGYHRPAHLKDFTAVHLRICFGHRAVEGDPDSQWVPEIALGPIVIGAGRHCGFGILAPGNIS